MPAAAALMAWVSGSSMVRARRRPVVGGREALIGAIGTVLNDMKTQGEVRVLGEVWHAHSTVPLQAGERVRVLAQEEGLRLSVEPEKKEESES